MHSVTAPEVEARHLYLEQSKLEERLETHQELVIWDVGLGAASNAMAVIQEHTKKSQTKNSITILSFENDLDSLKLALDNTEAFPHLSHPAPKELLTHGKWSSPEHKLTWKLIPGDFKDQFPQQRKPHVIYYDLYSSKRFPEHWSVELFAALFEHCKGEPTQLITYTTSTAVRATLLVQGFTVCYGASAGPKESTTVVFNDETLALKLGFAPLGTEWLGRWERSRARIPQGVSPEEVATFEVKIRQHKQFK